MVLYGYETWSQTTLREEREWSVFASRVLKIILVFGLKRNEVTGFWRKLHNEELLNLYSRPSTSIIRMVKPRRIR
jgi:hypothetical protein